MQHRNWKTLGLILALSVLLPSLAAAGIEQKQLQAVKDLSMEAFGYSLAPVPNPPQSEYCTDAFGNHVVCIPCKDGNGNPVSACPDPSATCSQLTTGSVNQKLLARTWYYGWTLRYNPSDVSCARNLLVEHLTNQFNNGHYSFNANTDEILTTSHFQLYAGAMAGAYLFALTNGSVWSSPLPTPDNLALTPVRKWWLDEKKLWDELRQGGVIDAPGARNATTNPPTPPSPGATNMPYRNWIDGQLRNIRPPALPPQWATDRWYTGGWILEEMFNRSHNPTNLVAAIGGYTPSVRVHDTLCIYKTGGEWLIYFPQLRNASETVFWVQSRAGQPHVADPVRPGVVVTPAVKPANFSTNFAPSQFLGRKTGSMACPPSNAL